MNKEILKERLYEYFSEQSTHDIVQLHNNYCEAVNCEDDKIYENEVDFFELHYHDRMMDLVRALGGNQDYRYQD